MIHPMTKDFHVPMMMANNIPFYPIISHIEYVMEFTSARVAPHQQKKLLLAHGGVLLSNIRSDSRADL